jgi:hypothetical protein
MGLAGLLPGDAIDDTMDIGELLLDGMVQPNGIEIEPLFTPTDFSEIKG